MQNKIELYQASNGQIEFRGDTEDETIWVTQKQIAHFLVQKYFTDGYAINETKITQTKTILNNLKQTIEFLPTKQIGLSK